MPNFVAELNLNAEISQLKQTLEYTVIKHQYNLKHPQVVQLSQRLDGLIIQVMKNQELYR